MRSSPVIVLATLATLAAPAVGGAAQQDQLIPQRTKGRASAPVTMYEISDFQCPFCAEYALQTAPTLDREYVQTGKVKVVFVNFPLPMHRNSEPAAELAMCAARQGKFWAMHDLLFRTQRRWQGLAEPGSFFLGLADSVGADRDSLTACVRDAAERGLVRSDAEGAVRSGAHSTPTFYVEGGLIIGAQPLEVFRSVLDSIVRAKSGSR